MNAIMLKKPEDAMSHKICAPYRPPKTWGSVKSVKKRRQMNNICRINDDTNVKQDHNVAKDHFLFKKSFHETT